MIRVKRAQNASSLSSYKSEGRPSEEAIQGCLFRLNQARTDRKQILSIEYILDRTILLSLCISINFLDYTHF